MDRLAMVNWRLVARQNAEFTEARRRGVASLSPHWPMERKHWPIRDVAVVGLEEHPQSFDCYAQSDREPCAPNRENYSHCTSNRRSTPGGSVVCLRGTA